ncbi:hypothetical protein [Roseomonas xinghualingensis]|uniref:hypothetical protein n=1 Tax=Roseomonas xinghualingensis TaxID=2986475 RepID=UPI0021F13D24|nr:hypothetical protein [Roseomonas sp. SXEYE001]MCV4207167.1 hypothetical protein [Roseomonas sp. SXEYE001]
MSDRNAPPAAPHLEEMRAEMELRIADATDFRSTVRETPAGLVAATILVSTILLSAAVLVRAARGRPY